CPCPVSASDPYNSANNRTTRVNSPRVSSPRAKSAAARIGPIVCELDGPIPTLKISNMLVFTESLPKIYPTLFLRPLTVARRPTFRRHHQHSPILVETSLVTNPSYK